MHWRRVRGHGEEERGVVQCVRASPAHQEGVEGRELEGGEPLCTHRCRPVVILEGVWPSGCGLGRGSAKVDDVQWAGDEVVCGSVVTRSSHG